VLTVFGPVRYVVFVIDIGARRVEIAGITDTPQPSAGCRGTAAWS